MINSIPNYKSWLTPIASLWQPRSEYLSVKQSQITLETTLSNLNATLERIDSAVDENTQAIAKLTKYLEDKGL
ncbi:hypothetical protein H6G74_15475 [Nostoc spongiaeforme FACHB-130]|uniref:Uncharacterized protein n=1 Tax=Nostoc spongiaeforme FACHB-130 TaxID=1357510 RepID=A0ABR8FWA0_9NOSO|nr:hypothetical protein [Nostoc spongiaeforme]MBD2595717.1 hypothetical protein [Nostoc spongiaeforme FACHB-130]